MSIRAAFIVGLLAMSCASTPKRQENAAPARMPDSPPEKAAAVRDTTDEDMHLDVEDDRWGVEKARERKEREKQKKQQQTGPAAPPPPTSPSDLKAPPTTPPAAAK